MIRYVVMKVEACPYCVDSNYVSICRDADGEVISAGCPTCRGTNKQYTEIDADEWLAAALVRLGMVSDGK